MLYAQVEPLTKQMIGEPRELPARWTTKEGATILNLNQLPIQPLVSLGWLPVLKDDLPSSAYYHSDIPRYDAEKQSFVFDVLPKDISDLIKLAEDTIDEAASNTCLKYMSTGAGQEMRYLEKTEQAKAFLSAEDRTPELFPMIYLEAESCGMEPEAKAIEILATRAAWTQLAAAIESLRVGGKAACRGMVDTNGIIEKRNEIVADLEAI